MLGGKVSLWLLGPLGGQEGEPQASCLPRHILPAGSLLPWGPHRLPPPLAPADSMIRVGTNYQAVIPECKPGEWQGQAAEGGAFRARGLALSPTWGSPWQGSAHWQGRQAGRQAAGRGWRVAPWHGEFSCAAFLSGSLSIPPFPPGPHLGGKLAVGPGLLAMGLA